MRVERWYWLIVFCVVSLLIHGGILYNSRNFHSGIKLDAPQMVEVTLAPPDEAVAPPMKEPELPLEKVIPIPETKPEPKPQEDANVPLADIAPPSVYRPPVRVRLDEPEQPLQKEIPIVQPDEKVVVKPNAEPGGELPDKDEKPLPLGNPNRPRST